MAALALLVALVPSAGGARDGTAAHGRHEVSAVYDLGDGRYLQVSALVEGEEPGVLRFDDLIPGAEPASDVGAAYALWRKWPADLLPVTVWYNPEGAPEGIDGAAIVQWAAETWNAVPGQTFRFAYGGTSAAHPAGCSPQTLDGENTVSWGLPPSTSPGTLAVTCALFVGPQETVDGVTKVIEADLFINPNVSWSDEAEMPPGRWDLASNVLHELGHVLGLNHSSACAVEVEASAQCPRADLPVMNGDLYQGEQRREPRPDDIEGVLDLYGLPPVLDFKVTLAGLAHDP